MNADPAERDTDSWRILLCAGRGLELLVLKRPLGICLPVLRIPRHERIAENLNAEARRSWNLDTVCIAPITVPHPDRTSGDARYHLMEVLRPEELGRIAPKAMDFRALKADCFSDTRDYLAVRRAMKLDAGEALCDQPGPFSDFGAFRRISAWVKEQLEALGWRWDGAFRQLHSTESFALIRFQTRDGAVWFKATGEPNRRELAITRGLAKLYPAFLPEIISVREDWNAWLTKEAEGLSLDSNRDLGAWCQAADSLARLQIASIGQTSSVLDCGAHDSRTVKLLSEVTPFFTAIGSLMERQIKASPQRLSAQEIRSLELRVGKALRQLESLLIPDALNHFDLNPGNTIVRSGGCTFLDWAEAGVGYPFLSFEYLRQHFLRTFGNESGAATKFRRSYINVWSTLLPQSAIDHAMALLPLVAPFAFAATTLPWNTSTRKPTPESAAFLRSLARQMQREAEQLMSAA